MEFGFLKEMEFGLESGGLSLVLKDGEVGLRGNHGVGFGFLLEGWKKVWRQELGGFERAVDF